MLHIFHADADSEEFREPNQDWLHIDQGAQREGLHAYQGAVYLEEQTTDDYCFRVLAKSHKLHKEFFEKYPAAVTKTQKLEFYKLSATQKKWYKDEGAELTYVPVPKGGIVIWDSRTVHDNTPPSRDRSDSDRWRFVVFVSMTPAHWASEEDIRFKQDAYRKMLITSHWSSQNLKTFKPFNINMRKRGHSEISIQKLPDEARSEDARRLSGVEPYDFDDGLPNGPDKPKWRSS